MQIDWWTLALQVVNFLVLAWLLWRFLYRPVQAVIEKRRQAAAEAGTRLDKARAAADKEKEKFASARRDLAEERRALIRKVHQETAQDRDRTLNEARAKADEIVRTARERVEDDRRQAKDALKRDIADLAADMAAHLLQSVSPDQFNTLLLDSMSTRLSDMPQPERTRMAESLKTDDARIVVTTATSLPDDARSQWTDRLRHLTGLDVRVDFRTDDDLIGGAELRLPHAVMTFTWADQLNRVKEAIAPT